MKIIHIGLPKTGTTSLQRNVFPVLCLIKDINWYRGKGNNLYSEIRRHIAKMRFGYKVSKIKISDKDFISDEGLCGWDPHYWEEFAEKNLTAFGSDTHIILTIRKPSDFLNSVYVETCLHGGDVQDPKDFFLKKKYYSERLETAKFSIDELSYVELVSFYSSRFEKVTVVKYEDIKKLNFLKELFSLSDSELNRLQQIFISKKIHNRAFSIRGARIVFSFSRFLNLFGLSLRKHTSHRTLHELKMIKDDGVYKSNNFRQSVLKKIGLLFIRELNWKNFIQERIDRILPYKKFRLNFNDIDIDIDKYDEEYNKIKV